MVAGGAAGAVYWLTVYPADIIKSKLQTDSFRRPAYRGTLDCARQVSYRTCLLKQLCGSKQSMVPMLINSVQVWCLSQ